MNRNCKSFPFIVAAFVSLFCASVASAQSLAPNSIKGLTVVLNVTNGNGLNVSPGSPYGLSSSVGSVKNTFNTSSWAQLNFATDRIEAFGPYTYTRSGNVGTVTIVIAGATVVAGAPVPPSTPNVLTLTFTSSLGGTFTQAWGNSTDLGTFSLDPGSDLVPLVNISTRVDLLAGQTAIPGFVVGGPIPRKVLIRAAGPSLGLFGVSTAIPSTTLSIYSGNQVIATNTSWSSVAANTAALQAAFNSVGAFGFPVGSKDSAVLLTLAPGNYSAIGGGAVATDSGTILLEVYFVP